MRTVFKNTENIILVFSKNCSCYLNLMFYLFSVFFIIKKNKNQTCSLYFLYSCFSEQKQFSKTGTKHVLYDLFMNVEAYESMILELR